MMPASSSSEYRDSLGEARHVLTEHVLCAASTSVDGKIVEISHTDDGDFAIGVWDNVQAFQNGSIPLYYDRYDMCDSTDWRGSVQMVYWIFGPQRVSRPSRVYRWISDRLTAGGLFLVAFESAYARRIPRKQDRSMYTIEEVDAALTRSAFSPVSVSVQNESFTFLSARRTDRFDASHFFDVEYWLQVNNWKKAFENLEKLDDRIDSLAAAREYALLLAACYDLAGNRQETVIALEEAARIDPCCARAYCGLGRLRAMNGEMDAAARLFALALELQPCLLAALRGFALICEQFHDYESAYRMLRRAFSVCPSDDGVLLNIIRLATILGDHDRVVRYLNAISQEVASPLMGTDGPSSYWSSGRMRTAPVSAELAKQA